MLHQDKFLLHYLEKDSGKKPAQCCAACLDSCQTFYVLDSYAQLFFFFPLFFGITFVFLTC